MNRAHRLIWNEHLRTWIAVAETARSRGKRCGTVSRLGSLLALACTAMLGSPAPAAAGGAAPTPPAATQLPTGGRVSAGSASIAPAANATLTINQDSARAAIDWQQFDIGAGATVRFNQPSSASATLNRVLGSDPSRIFGRLSANGQVFLTNAQGIYFSPSASADVGGLVATTHGIATNDFMAGRLVFDRRGATAGVVNEGRLEASLGGFIALLAPEVRNQGVIVAQMGTVALAAGEAIELHFDGQTLAGVRVTPAALSALVDNGHAVQAPGGLIILSAQAASRLQAGIVRNTGTVEATGLVNDGGKIRLLSSDTIEQSGSLRADAVGRGRGGRIELIADTANPTGLATVSGTLSARGGGLGGDGGQIETSAHRVTVQAGTVVDTRAPHGTTGRWTLDPDGYSVAAFDGDISGATLSANLATTDVAIASTAGGGSDGHVRVADTVNWSANQLTLTASGDIAIDAVMTASGSARLDLEPGSGHVRFGIDGSDRFIGRVDFPGRSGSGFLTINGNDTTVIRAVGDEGSSTALDLQGLNGALGGHFALGADIDASAAQAWNGSLGFSPIGLSAGGSVTPFSGSLDGLGHVINSLTITRDGALSPTGLFAELGAGALVRNLGMDQASIQGGNQVGTLAGIAAGRVDHVVARGSVGAGGIGGGNDVGGLIGSANGLTVDTARVSVSITANGSAAGGLIGRGDNGIVSNAWSGGAVFGAGAEVGGLVGHLGEAGQITGSTSTGTVNGQSAVGGLVGANRGILNLVQASGNVVASSGAVGGLVGDSVGGGISDAHAGGIVNASFGGSAGGLVGSSNGTVMTNVYATGKVSGVGAAIGGLVGRADGTTVLNAFATGDVDGSDTGTGIGGLIGAAADSAVTNAYATGRVTGLDQVGGLIGDALATTMRLVYSAGSVNPPAGGGGADFGRLIGLLGAGSTVDWAYSIGSVGGSESAPLVGTDSSGLPTPVTHVVPGDDTILNPWTGPASGGQWTAYDPAATADPNWGLGHAPTVFETAVFAGASVAVPGIVLAKDLVAPADSALHFTGTTVSSLTLGQDKQVSVDAQLDFGPAGRLNLTGGDSLVLNRLGKTYDVIQSLGSPNDWNGGALTLQGMADVAALARNFVLGLDVNASETAGWNPNGEGFYPIGRLFADGGGAGQAFTGNFDGLGHAVTDLSINRTAGTDGQGVGLFGWLHAGSDPASTQQLANIRLIQPVIAGHSDVGALVGVWDTGGGAGLLSQAQVVRGFVFGRSAIVSGTETAATRVGGVAGSLVGSPLAMDASTADAEVGDLSVFSTQVGGLVGSSDGPISRSTTSGRVLAGNGATAGTAFEIGGLAGRSGDISDSGSTSQVRTAASSQAVGGLAGGTGSGATISRSWAAGDIVVGDIFTDPVGDIGGLVGRADGVLDLVTARGTVLVNGDGLQVGGLVGSGIGTVTQASAGADVTVTGQANAAGGLIGMMTGNVSQAHAFGAVHTGPSSRGVGGLIGEFQDGGLHASDATGDVTSDDLSAFVGGLVGHMTTSDPVAIGVGASDVFATGVVRAGAQSIGVGGLIGASDGSVTNARASGAVSAGPESLQIGGLVGLQSGASITDSSASGAVLICETCIGSTVLAGASSVGGLIGEAANTSVLRVQASGTVTTGNASQDIGGLIGYSNNSAVADATASGPVSVGIYDLDPLSSSFGVGGLIGHLHAEPGSAAASEMLVRSSATGTVTAFGASVIGVGGLVGRITGASDASITLFDLNATGTVTVTAWGDNGHQAVGGLIGDAADEFGTTTIDLSNAHAFNRVAATGPGVQTGGLVGRADGASISDSDAVGDVSGDARVGGLVGSANGAAVLTRVSASGRVTGNVAVGGLIGSVLGSDPASPMNLIQGNASGRVTGHSEVGGLIGQSDAALVSDSHASGDVVGTEPDSRRIGGLIGYSGSNLPDQITQVSASGAVSGGSAVGGLVGQMDQGALDDATASGRVQGVDRVGGLVGHYGASAGANPFPGISDRISAASATGDVAGTSAVGGLVGQIDGGELTGGAAEGSVTGGSLVGGLVGSNAGQIGLSHASGPVNGTGDAVGGLVGSHAGSIGESWASGAVTGAGVGTGGLVGTSANGTVVRSFATGAVVGVTSVGGLIGSSDTDQVSDAYAAGSVVGDSAVGGLIGSAHASTIARTYASGAVSGTSDVGGLIGTAPGTAVVDAYWDLEASGQSFSAGGIARTTLQMQAQATFADFDFSSGSPVWAIHSQRNNSLPTLCIQGLPCNSDGGSGWAGTVQALMVDVTATQASSLYGSAIGDFGVALFKGAAPADLNALGISLAGSALFSGAPVVGSPVGPYTVTYGSGLTLAGVNALHFKLNARSGVSYSILPAPLTITADDIAKPYDGHTLADSPTVSYTGFVLNQDAGALSGAIAFGGSWAGAVHAGDYRIVPSGFTSTNYTIQFVEGRMTITKAHLLLTADDQTRLYGQANPALSLTLSGFVNGENATTASVSGSGVATTTATPATSVGQVAIVAGVGTLAAQDYDFTPADGLLTINKAHLLFTADDQSRLYGQPNPDLTVRLSGFVNGENAASAAVSGSGSASTTADATTPVGRIPIVADIGTLDAPNYDFTPVDGVLTIGKAHLLLTADDLSRLYGQPNPALTMSLAGFVNGEDAASANLTGAGITSTSATPTTPVGQVAIHAAVGTLEAQNYDFTPVDGVLTIGKAHLLLTADDQSRLYGQPNPALTVSLSGFVNGESATSAGVSGSGIASTTGTPATPVGQVAIVADVGTLDAHNYDFTPADGVLTIGKAHLTLTADDLSRLYGQPNPALTLSLAGFVNGETAASAAVTGNGSATTTADATTPVGRVAIVADIGTLDAPNYDFTPVDGVLTIGKAHLTLSADNLSRLYGQPNPALTMSLAGFVNGEDAASANIAGAGVATTGAIPTTPVGQVAIHADVGTLDAPNYDFVPVDGVLTIDQAHLSLKANDLSRLYGQANPALTTTLAGFVNGEDAISAGLVGTAGPATTSAVATTPVGTAVIHADTGTLAAPNYDLLAIDGNLTIAKAHLSLKADDLTRPFGRINPPLTATLTGFVNGETAVNAGIAGAADLSTPATPTSPVGTQPIIAAVGSLLAPNYDFVTVDGRLTITGETPFEQSPLRLLREPVAVAVPAQRPEAFAFVATALRTPGMVSADFEGLSLVVVQRTDASHAGIVVVTVPHELVAAGRGFRFELPSQVMTTDDGAGATATLVNGDPLPSWLRFDAPSRSLSAAAVASSELPVEVVIRVNGREIRVRIVERPAA